MTVNRENGFSARGSSLFSLSAAVSVVFLCKLWLLLLQMAQKLQSGFNTVTHTWIFTAVLWLLSDGGSFANPHTDSSISSSTRCRLQGLLGGLFVFILPLNHLHSAPFDRHMKVHSLQYIWSKDVGLSFSFVGPADNSSLPLCPKCILNLTWTSKWGCIYPERDHFQRKFIFHPWTSFIWPDCKTLWSVQLKKCALVLRVFSDCAGFNRKI